MDGYSVAEAASILGVPTERVWELLARGVLAGASEGETGMRVFLQPRSAPVTASATPPTANPARSSEPERELSPFRELLTEFRNLTERYGQALLALGEARGEVASLRSRVDMLEARMDLRLPFGGPGPGSTWSADAMRAAAPPPAEPAVGLTSPPPASAGPREVQPPVDGAAHPGGAAPPHPENDEDAERRARRRRSGRRATENFAEALARAQDPSPPELPGAAEAAAALAALRDAPSEVADAALPRELPAAEWVPIAEEVPGARAAAAPIAGPAPEPLATTQQPEAPEEDAGPAEAAPASVADDFEAAPAASAEAGTRAAHIADEPVPRTEDATSLANEAPSVAAVAEAVPSAEVPSGPTWDSDRYTTVIEEPDWYAADEPGGTHRTEDAVATEDSVASAVASHEPEVRDEAAAHDDAPTPIRPVEREPTAPEHGEPPRDEEKVPWHETGDGEDAAWNEIEASGARGRAQPDWPGSRELDDALAALDALAAGPGSVEPAPEVPQPVPAAVEARDERPPAAPIAPLEPRPVDRGSPPGTLLREVRRPGPIPPSPASRAYRRLRRIFPS